MTVTKKDLEARVNECSSSLMQIEKSKTARNKYNKIQQIKTCRAYYVQKLAVMDDFNLEEIEL